jgi:O-antigen/teichoic acid export membrane protein
MLKEMFRPILFLFSNETLAAICNVVTSILIARYFGPEAFGIWGIFLLILSYGEAFGRVKVELASIYIFNNNTYSLSQVLFSVNIITLASCGIVISIFYLLSEYIFNFLFSEYSNPPLIPIFVIGAIFFFQAIYYNYIYIFLAAKKSFTFGFANLLRSAFFLLLVSIFIYYDHLTITFVLYLLLVSYLAILSLLVFYFQINFGHDFSAPKQLFSTLFVSGRQFYFMTIASTINISMPMILATQFLSPVNLGLFSVAKSFSETLFSRLASSFYAVLYAFIAHSKDLLMKKMNDTIKTYFILLVALSLVVITLYLFGDKIINLVYGLDYLASAPILKILMIGYGFYYSSLILVQYFQGIGNIAKIKYFYIFTASLQFLLGFHFINIKSISSIAYICSVSMSILSLLLIAYFFIERQLIKPKAVKIS